VDVLKNKLIVITGSTGGIGRVISRSLLDQGYDIIGIYFSNKAEADSLVQYSENKRGKFFPVRATFTSEDTVRDAVESIKKINRKIDGLIHCAASGVHRAFPELTVKHFKWAFEINFFSLVQMVLELKGLFNKKARVVGLSSLGTYQYIGMYSTVGTSKSAMEALIQYIATECSELGLRVNVIRSGLVLTDTIMKVPSLASRVEISLKRTPTARLTTPLDIANVVTFMLSEAAEQINAQIIQVDGGIRSDYANYIANMEQPS